MVKVVCKDRKNDGERDIAYAHTVRLPYLPVRLKPALL